MPGRRTSRCGYTAFTALNVPTRLLSNTRRHSSMSEEFKSPSAAGAVLKGSEGFFQADGLGQYGKGATGRPQITKPRPGGIGHRHALQEVFSAVRFVPTGGIRLSDAPAWVGAGVAAVGRGGTLQRLSDHDLAR